MIEDFRGMDFSSLKSLLILAIEVTLALGFVLIFSNQLIIETGFFPIDIGQIIFLVQSIVIMAISKPHKWLKNKRNTITQNLENPLWKRILAVYVLVLIRISLSFYYRTIYFSSIGILRILYILADTLTTAIFEELVFKALYLRILSKSKLPIWFSALTLSIVFSLLHFPKNFDLFFSRLSFQFLTMILFCIYPSLMPFILCHWITNFFVYSRITIVI